MSARRRTRKSSKASRPRCAAISAPRFFTADAGLDQQDWRLFGFSPSTTFLERDPILTSSRRNFIRKRGRPLATGSVRSDRIWMDGEMVPYDQANVHVLTHSLHYGLAVFEGMRCYKSENGRSAIFRASEHIRRLFDSAHIVEMHIPFTQEEVVKACVDVVRVNKFDE